MVTVVVPAFNEEANLKDAVLTICEAAKIAGNLAIQIIVVNDASSDQTGAIADSLAREINFVQVVHHKTNQGLGSALIDGLNLAQYPKICLFPGDNAVHQLTMVSIFKNVHRADLVIAYLVNTEARSFFRLVLSGLFTKIYAITFGVHIMYINGAPAYSVDLLKKLGPLNARRYSLLAEIHIKLLRQGATYYEVDGYLKPSQKSSAIKLNSLKEVITSFLKLFYEVYFKNPAKYLKKPIRVLPDGSKSRSLKEEKNANAIA